MSQNRFGSLELPRRTILGPGPSSANPRVLRAMSRPIVGYLDPVYFRAISEVEEMLRIVFRTEGRAFAVAGAGSAAMEAGLVSLLEPGDTVVVCSYGYFCERIIDMCERIGADVVPVRTEWGRAMDPEALEEVLDRTPNVKVVAAIHAETSAGVLQPLEELSRLAHQHDALFLVDAVTSLAGCDVRVDDWGLDYVYSGAQKCLAAPPGISPVAVSREALDAVRRRKRKPSSWYLDIGMMADYWSPERKPHHTSPISMVYALHEALVLTLEEGLEARFERHARTAAGLRAGLKALGLVLPIPDCDRLNQLTVVTVPAGIDDAIVRNQLLDEYGIEIGRGFGQFMGKVWRIGLMGESCNPANVLAVLSALEAVLPRHGFEVAAGAGVAAASAEFARNPVRVP